MTGNPREDPPDSEVKKSPFENDMELIRSIVQKIREILIQEGTKKDEIRRRVTKLLTEMGVPFTGINIEEDIGRSDKKSFCGVRVYVPDSWPSDRGRGGQYFFSASVPPEK